MLNARTWRLDIFLVWLNQRNEERLFSERERERDRASKRDWEKDGHILLAQVTSRVRATRSNGTFEFGRLLLRNARGENSGERQRLESRRRLNVSHARDIEWLWILSENDGRRLWRRSSRTVARIGHVSNAPQMRHTVKNVSIQKAIVRKCTRLSISFLNVSFTQMETESSLRTRLREGKKNIIERKMCGKMSRYGRVIWITRFLKNIQYKTFDTRVPVAHAERMWSTYLQLWDTCADLWLSRKLLGTIRNAHNEHLVIFRPYPLPKTPQRDGIRERRMRKAKPCAARGGIAYVAQIVVTRNVLVVREKIPMQSETPRGGST